MNNRDYKEFASGSYYHIFNRGNGKKNIFLDNEDFSFFLFRLKESLDPDFAKLIIIENKKKKNNRSQSGERRVLLPKNSFDLVCYCLMPNHYHFLIRQNSDVSITKLISKICTSYSKYFNKKYKHSGHLFQDKFRAVHVDSNEYLIWLSAYIHDNPKTAGLVKRLSDYDWSSYNDYIKGRKGDLCKNDIVLSQFNKPEDYKKFVEESEKLILEKKKENLEILSID